MTTATVTKPATENICRWVEGKQIAADSLRIGCSAVLKVIIGDDITYYRISRLPGESRWLVGKEAPNGDEPVFYKVDLSWSVTECDCDSCLWTRRKQMKQARLECKPVAKLFECKHIRFVRNALKEIGVI